MTENNVTLRTTTISLDEYNDLTGTVKEQRETIGANRETISLLKEEISKIEEKQPEVKITHWENQYNKYDERMELDFKKVEFTNLTEVVSMAEQKAKKEVKVELDRLENSVDEHKSTIKQLRDNVETIQEKVKQEDKLSKKRQLQYHEDLEEKSETYTKNVEGLKKTYKEDEKEYKETILDLKEEIKKVKDNKTDAEIEEKRNKEIKDLKGRIKDLEKLVEELGKLSFFKRMFKLREISAEKIAVQKELLDRERNANNVGTTYVKEGGKYRTYGRFADYINQLFYSANIKYAPRGWF